MFYPDFLCCVPILLGQICIPEPPNSCGDRWIFVSHQAIAFSKLGGPKPFFEPKVKGHNVSPKVSFQVPKMVRVS